MPAISKKIFKRLSHLIFVPQTGSGRFFLLFQLLGGVGSPAEGLWTPRTAPPEDSAVWEPLPQDITHMFQISYTPLGDSTSQLKSIGHNKKGASSFKLQLVKDLVHNTIYISIRELLLATQFFTLLFIVSYTYLCIHVSMHIHSWKDIGYGQHLVKIAIVGHWGFEKFCSCTKRNKHLFLQITMSMISSGKEDHCHDQLAGGISTQTVLPSTKFLVKEALERQETLEGQSAQQKLLFPTLMSCYLQVSCYDGRGKRGGRSLKLQIPIGVGHVVAAAVLGPFNEEKGRCILPSKVSLRKREECVTLGWRHPFTILPLHEQKKHEEQYSLMVPGDHCSPLVCHPQPQTGSNCSNITAIISWQRVFWTASSFLSLLKIGGKKEATHSGTKKLLMLLELKAYASVAKRDKFLRFLSSGKYLTQPCLLPSQSNSLHHRYYLLN